jgi:E3 ubiquitin-protein ligase RNF14
MDDNIGAEEDERFVELSSIAAIYPELIVDAKDPYTATLELAVTPIQPLKILFQPSADGAPPQLPTPPESQEHGQDGAGDRPIIQQLPLDSSELAHLPPLSLTITLPSDYPTSSPPTVSISTNPSWLSKSTLAKLKDDCARLWEELGKDQVVYTYIDHLMQEAEQSFGLAGETNASLPSDLKLALLDFNLRTKREHFERETFDCGICLEPKKGSNCYKLIQCEHVFCVPCLQDFYKSAITEGDVDTVKCLDPSCGKNHGPDGPRKRRKRDRTLNPSELLQIPIEQDFVQRFVRLKRKKRLEADRNTVYCPRQWCQGPARSKKRRISDDPLADSDSDSSDDEPTKPAAKKDSESTPMEDRLCICSDCSYAFCSVCKKSWHGPLARCSPRREKELKAEEAASIAYLEKHSTPCPTCNAPAQKTMGCNHMICFSCKTHFCYLCTAWLHPENPYTHFNTVGTECYQKLWVLEEGDGEGVDRTRYFNPEHANWDEQVAAEEDGDEDGAFAPALQQHAEDHGEEEPPLPPENFEAFGGDHPNPFEGEEEDSEDEEPAPDMRRNRQVIEIVNFAGGAGAQNRQFELPDRPRVEPAAAPAPARPARNPRRRGGGQQQNRQRNLAQEPARANNARRRPHQWQVQQPVAQPVNPTINFAPNDPPNPNLNRPANPVRDDPAANEDEEGPPLVPLPYGNPQAAQAAALQHFIDLAAEDREDEWDSDGVDDVDGFEGDGGEDEAEVRELANLDLGPRRGDRRNLLFRGGWR